MTITSKTTPSPGAQKRRCPECGGTRFYQQVMLCQEGEVYDRPGDDENFVPQKTVWEEVHEYAFCPDCQYGKTRLSG